MGDCALPINLKGKLHWDWPWPFSKIKRGWNAFGPRCPGLSCKECGGDSYRQWPPVLMGGKGVSRWEETGPGHSVLHIKKLDDMEVTEFDIYGKVFDGIEMNQGLPNFGEIVRVKLLRSKGYHPSAIQLYSKKGWMKTEPDFYCEWRRINDKYTYYHRRGYRIDSEDMYYNKTLIGYWGLKFE